jgi:hypothetical protein
MNIYLLFIETITSDTSLAPFDSNELARMLDLMDRIEGETGSGYAQPKRKISVHQVASIKCMPIPCVL